MVHTEINFVQIETRTLSVVLNVSKTLRISLTVVGEKVSEREGTSAFTTVLPINLLMDAHTGVSMGVKT